MAENFIVNGLPLLKPIPEISLGAVIYNFLSENPKIGPILINGETGGTISSSQLLQQTCSLAQALRNAGYGRNTMLAIGSKNALNFFNPIIASFYIGATIFPINYDYTLLELSHILNLSKPKVIFCSKGLSEKYSELQKKMTFIERIIIIDSEESKDDMECIADFIAENLKGPLISEIDITPVNAKEDVACIMGSSGTTGLPKGVMMTHYNISTLCTHFKDPRIHDQNHISFCVPPFFHVYGFCITIAGMLLSRPTVFLPEFHRLSFLKAIETHKVTRLFLVPPLVIFLAKHPMILEYDLSSLKEIICAAAPLKDSTENEVLKRLNLKAIRQAYGLTETSSAITFNDKDQSKYKPGSSGKIQPGMQLAVKDTQTGELLGPNQSGEICIRGPAVMKGYYDNKEATKNTISEDGWLHTGDLGHYDNDEYLFITDRIKEVIKYKAYQVAPAELEALLLTHPGVLDSGVVGKQDEDAGELPTAFIVKKYESITERDIQKFVEERLSQAKWLRGGVYFVEKIPKSVSGKILRRELRRILNEQN